MLGHANVKSTMQYFWKALGNWPITHVWYWFRVSLPVSCAIGEEKHYMHSNLNKNLGRVSLWVLCFWLVILLALQMYSSMHAYLHPSTLPLPTYSPLPDKVLEVVSPGFNIWIPWTNYHTRQMDRQKLSISTAWFAKMSVGHFLLV